MVALQGIRIFGREPEKHPVKKAKGKVKLTLPFLYDFEFAASTYKLYPSGPDLAARNAYESDKA
jgi:hypothetical protein